ncbi:hypothetical protein Agabi119p4_10169 [Agaricus bisporus var. burnettii]|uniref:Uncharacterized protein n=1 Tax=Agaricus bisporus var. burnettii TaxID=192524 RepID=A0A8H7C2E5_AGABI|nr:hypothetical protein Agabi119p4_10169 [Agaricus bisporus var. burnettii]
MSSVLVDEYNHNFCYPVPKALENDRVKLIPFIPSKHAQPFVDATLPHPEVFKYLPVGPHTDALYFSFSSIKQGPHRHPLES